ncbi:uncharacterized protein UTRI_02885 [Ustilago trichophora]|uniref:Uncharacterized protein n=1 Tax=Ustilago trichophora TaxID=86804 RepID=A0A5C3EP56_9BASI|nr:uncharacterized protein UTRI_02885 [Ustilago trichophora]
MSAASEQYGITGEIVCRVYRSEVRDKHATRQSLERVLCMDRSRPQMETVGRSDYARPLTTSRHSGSRANVNVSPFAAVPVVCADLHRQRLILTCFFNVKKEEADGNKKAKVAGGADLVTELHHQCESRCKAVQSAVTTQVTGEKKVLRSVSGDNLSGIHATLATVCLRLNWRVGSAKERKRKRERASERPASLVIVMREETTEEKWRRGKSRKQQQQPLV